MRLPETIERLYLDFDGFFASVEQQADKRLRGRPIGIVPFTNTEKTCVIACLRESDSGERRDGRRRIPPQIKCINLFLDNTFLVCYFCSYYALCT